MLAVPSDASSIRLKVRCTIPASLVPSGKFPPQLEIVATISLANGRFCPDAGMDIKGDKSLRIEFPQRNTLKLMIKGGIRAFKNGLFYVGFPSAQVQIAGLLVEMNNPAVAIVGEMAHTPSMGTLFVTTPGNPEGEWLHPKNERRPLAIRMPE